MKHYMPKDIYEYIIREELEADFFSALTRCHRNFTIGEITDREFVREGEVCRLKSKTYGLNLEITDDEIVTAICNQIYVSAFISRYQDSLQVHFLVHQYPISMKSRFDEEIMKEVLLYMIMKTILTLRLDKPEKVVDYIHMK